MNGKGSAPRNCFSPAYRRNYDAIFRRPTQRKKITMSSSAASTAMKYYFEYKYDAAGKPKVARWDTMATNPIQAVNYFHEHVQRHADYDSARNLLRPKLPPTGYTLVLFKRDGFAPYDLPITANPDLRPVKKVKAPPPPTFDFMETAVGGRLAQ